MVSELGHSPSWRKSGGCVRINPFALDLPSAPQIPREPVSRRWATTWVRSGQLEISPRFLPGPLLWSHLQWHQRPRPSCAFLPGLLLSAVLNLACLQGWKAHPSGFLSLGLGPSGNSWPGQPYLPAPMDSEHRNTAELPGVCTRADFRWHCG